MDSEISLATPYRMRKPSVESYAHKAAKQVVVEWLRSAARKVGEDNYAHLDGLGIVWRVNRGAPYYGVWEEYPILHDGAGLLPPWDEEWPGAQDRPPSYSEMCAAGRPPAAIFDVAVQHKGQINYAIEIVHRNPMSHDKMHFLQGLSERPAVLVLPAAWVLRQVRVPTKLPSDDCWVFDHA